MPGKQARSRQSAKEPKTSGARHKADGREAREFGPWVHTRDKVQAAAHPDLFEDRVMSGGMLTVTKGIVQTDDGEIPAIGQERGNFQEFRQRGRAETEKLQLGQGFTVLHFLLENGQADLHPTFPLEIDGKVLMVDVTVHPTETPVGDPRGQRFGLKLNPEPSPRIDHGFHDITRPRSKGP